MLLTMKEKQVIEVMQRIMDGRLGVGQAATVLDRSERQIWRLLKKIRKSGIEGIRHGNKGKESPRKRNRDIQKKVLELARGRFKDINDTHLCEILEREEGIFISRESLRSLLRSEGIAPKLKRRSPKHRLRRERKEAFGMMLQIDASRHDWLEGRGPYFTIVGAIDDATGFVWARVVESETTWAYLELLEEIIRKEGMPLSLYSDRHSIFHVLRESTVEEQLEGRKPLTQFGRAMGELGISIIKAWSPQAKGRVERFWRTLQDRLVVELRLAGATTLEEAQTVLEKLLGEHNRKFTLSASGKPVFRKAPKGLERILCLKETRTVAKDHTISFEGIVFQIPPSRHYRTLQGRRVTVLQLRCGSLEIACKNKTVARFSPETVRHMVEQHAESKCQLKKAV